MGPTIQTVWPQMLWRILFAESGEHLSANSFSGSTGKSLAASESVVVFVACKGTLSYCINALYLVY